MKDLRIKNMTWKEYHSRVNDSILILPVGATEQHGPHLPLGVDTILAENYSLNIAQHVNGVVAPPLSYGYKSQPASGGGPMFPGTVDLKGETLTLLVRDLLEEYIDDGWKKIFIMSGHYENDAFLAEAADLLLRKQTEAYPKILLSNWWDNVSEEVISKVFDVVSFKGWALEHAAIAETSMMMHFSPELVQEELIPDQEIEHPPAYQSFPPSPSMVPASGCLHTARTSSTDKGRLIVDNVIDNITSFLKDM